MHAGRRCRPRTSIVRGIAAGAIGSPKLLELSGIGDPAVLGRLGIPVRHALAGVGDNLQDHLQIRTVYKVGNTLTLIDHYPDLLSRAAMGIEYAVMRSGPLSMAPSQLGIFAKSDSRLATADLEYHVQPLSTDRLSEPLHRFSAVTVSVCNLRPESRGSVHATSLDPTATPAIVPRYLSTEGDRAAAIRSIRHARRLTAARALAPYAPQEWQPGPSTTDDAAILKAAGDIATTIFHPVGTCRMGTGADAVVDPRLGVHGLDGLVIADASIMPTIVSGNTASPVLMIAEKAAAMLREGAVGCAGPGDIARIQDRINATPPDCLGLRTPAEVMTELVVTEAGTEPSRTG